MTPCEEKGYEVGQVFMRVGDSNGCISGNIHAGDILVLESCGNYDLSEFHSLTGQTKGSTNSNAIEHVRRIWPPEEKSKSVEVVCEGKTTTLTREDAEKLNLC